MSGRPAQRTPGRGWTLLAIVVIAIFVIGGLLAAMPGGGGDDDGEDDLVVQITPGAEVAELQTAVAQNPKDIDSVMILAEMLANSGRAGESVAWFERAVAARPDDASLRLAFGRALQRAGKPFDAELQLQKAAELDPSSVAAAFYLGLLYERWEPPRRDEAVAWYQRAVEIDAESAIAAQARERLAELAASGTPTSQP